MREHGPGNERATIMAVWTWAASHRGNAHPCRSAPVPTGLQNDRTDRALAQAAGALPGERCGAARQHRPMAARTPGTLIGGAVLPFAVVVLAGHRGVCALGGNNRTKMNNVDLITIDCNTIYGTTHASC